MQIGVHTNIHSVDKFVIIYCSQGFINFMVSGIRVILSPVID